MLYPLKNNGAILSFSDVAGLKNWTTSQWIPFSRHFRNTFLKELLQTKKLAFNISLLKVTVLLIIMFIRSQPWMTVLVLFSSSRDAILTFVKCQYGFTEGLPKISYESSNSSLWHLHYLNINWDFFLYLFF